MHLPNSLFFRTASTLVITSFVMVAITLVSIAYFVLIPVARQSTDDLASFLILSAQTWVELPSETRLALETELMDSHRLKLVSAPDQPSLTDSNYPYLAILKEAIDKRLGQSISIGYLPDHEGWFWVDIPMADKVLRFGFMKDRVGGRPSIALLTISITILILALFTALILAMRLSKPLARLSEATSTVGKGGNQLSLSETGPDEIATLAKNFNQMSREVTELLENRTTLLAGVSHDLRTPLTRINLAIELMSEAQDKDLISGLKNNVAEIDQLLEETLILARGVENQEEVQEKDLSQELSNILARFQNHQAQINWRPGAALNWPIPLKTFNRILNNLLENAIRYGNDKPIDIRLSLDKNIPVISILDRGPGIPEKMQEAIFRPFFRLEDSRNTKTGGSGLGLAIVKQLCIAQGWEISLRPREGGGTEAYLKLGDL